MQEHTSLFVLLYTLCEVNSMCFFSCAKSQSSAILHDNLAVACTCLALLIELPFSLFQFIHLKLEHNTFHYCILQIDDCQK